MAAGHTQRRRREPEIPDEQLPQVADHELVISERRLRPHAGVEAGDAAEHLRRGHLDELVRIGHEIVDDGERRKLAADRELLDADVRMRLHQFQTLLLALQYWLTKSWWIGMRPTTCAIDARKSARNFTSSCGGRMRAAW